MKSITVVIPSFNSMKYIKQSVESVLSQNYNNLQIWACDNESTDGTYEYLQSLKDKRLTVFSLPNIYPNGYREAIELVFQNSKTDFVTFVCSDDFIEKSYISKCMRTLHFKSNLKCLQSPLSIVRENIITSQFLNHSYNNMDEFKKEFLIRSPVNNPSVIYHRELWPLIKNGRLAHEHNNLEDMGAGDYDVWGNFASNNIYIYPVKAFLGYYYRWHSGQCTWIVHKQSVNYDKAIQNYYKERWQI